MNKWPSIQVVIEDNNEIKLTSHPSQQQQQQHQQMAEDESHHVHHSDQNPFANFFNNLDFLKDFDSIDFSSHHSNEIKQSKNEFLRRYNNDSTKKYAQSIDHPPRYLTPKLVNPSFSKIPDVYIKPSENDNFVDFNVDHPDDHGAQSMEYRTSKKPLVVPIGSRVHFFRIKDYNKPESSQIISKFDYEKNEPYEPSIIELPSTKPVLPIVFNFKTKSSPIFTKTTHSQPIEKSPKYQFFETKEPPHYRKHTIHKPIIQDFHEIIVPYRFYVQEIQPVEEFRHTMVPLNVAPPTTNKNVNQFNHHDDNSLQNPFVTSSMTKVPIFAPGDLEPHWGHTNHLVPYYGDTQTIPVINLNPMNMVPSKNPFSDYYHPPYRVQGSYYHFKPYKQSNYMNTYNHFNYR